jgi:hypothetical protein
MGKWSVVAVALILAAGGLAFSRGQTQDGLSQQDRQKIVNVALDYIDGFYEGNAERMTRAIHPDVAKRIISVDPSTGKQYLRSTSAQRLVEATASGMGKQIAQQYGKRSDVTILDTFGDIACVRVDAITWVDYLQVGKVDGEWKVINVLWAWRPGYGGE